MKISVIVCAYNSEDTIEKCLDSVCNQYYKDLEIVIVNDGSKDRTLEILKEYERKDSRIMLINQPNMGAGLAKNVGLAHATGDYITFVDSDDWIELDTYQDVAKQIVDTSCDMVVFNHNKIFSNKTVKNVRPIKNECIDLNELGRDTYIMRYIISYLHDLGACNKVIRRKIINDYKIEFSDNREMIYDDNMYSLKLICHVNKIISLAKSYYNYVIQDNSVSSMQNTYKKLAVSYTKLFCTYVNYLNQIKMYDQFEKAMPQLYYSMVYFGLIRLKHFGHFNVQNSISSLNEFEYYYEYMKVMNKTTARLKYLTQTMRKIDVLHNWQLAGLICLTLFQGKVITHYALKNDNRKVEMFL